MWCTCNLNPPSNMGRMGDGGKKVTNLIEQGRMGDGGKKVTNLIEHAVCRGKTIQS